MEGAQIGAQGKAAATTGTIRGLSVVPENYGTVSTEFGGIDVVLKHEGSAPGTTYGIRVRQPNTGDTLITSGYQLSNVSGAAGYTYGLDMYVDASNKVTIGTADIRLSNGATISNATQGNITVGQADTTTTFPGNVTVSGEFNTPIFVKKSADTYSVLATDINIMMTATGNSVATLPVVGLYAGQKITIINGSDDWNVNVTINATGGATIYGGSNSNTSEVAWHGGDSRTFQWDGSNWYVVNR